MLRNASILSLGLAALALASAPLGQAVEARGGNQQAPGVLGVSLADAADSVALSSGCTDRIVMSPTVIYNSAGGTFAGQVLDQISVYSSGLVVLASSDSLTGSMNAQMFHTSPLEVLRLSRELLRLGAGTLCDQATDASDLPLKTMSVASGIGPDVRLHSYSYWVPTDEFGIVESALEQWLLKDGIVKILPE